MGCQTSDARSVSFPFPHLRLGFLPKHWCPFFQPATPPSPFQSVYTAGETLTKRLADGKVRYDLVELENLRLFFISVIEVIERAKAGGGTAKEPEPPPGKKKILA